MAGIWAQSDAYEVFMGRWARKVAVEFVAWLGLPDGLGWLDVGCGTGALATAVLAGAEPSRVAGVDPSYGFVAGARAAIPRAGFAVGDARALPYADGRFDVVVSGLALNFVPDPARAVAECARVVRPGGTVAACVWDYRRGMGMLRHFWDAAVALDPAAAVLDEGARFPVCAPGRLLGLWGGLAEVSVGSVEVATVFAGFDDYWDPFLGGQGPAAGYVASLAPDRRDALRDLLRERLPHGPIPLTARAWVVRGRRGF
ncbi:class I SAM-dependent methyltransferase [Nonomuraea sp. NBC_01738]|uniref:class I SAM-dependent methyltransferase n=1 Tax=Nonomuraea sp. NBC_01738 TaxID=2976003 RepID=UPI002E12DE86|nr:class I SAM-dependent methyltransferase [Nonomuraea sp. NBC_01738]